MRKVEKVEVDTVLPTTGSLTLFGESMLGPVLAGVGREHSMGRWRDKGAKGRYGGIAASKLIVDIGVTLRLDIDFPRQALTIRISMRQIYIGAIGVVKAWGRRERRIIIGIIFVL
jgi:hypothetical protein